MSYKCLKYYSGIHFDRYKLKKKKFDMNFNNFTIKSQEVVQQAQQIAQGLGHQQIENAHILKGIFEVDENVIPFILNKLSVNIDIFKQTLENILQSFPKVSGGDLVLSRNANSMLTDASNIAKKNER